MRAEHPFSIEMPSPVGTLFLASDGASLTALSFGERNLPQRECAALQAAREQLAEYFAGRRRAFDLPLAPEGTPFQQSVWRALLSIPYGETRSYLDIARSLGKPGASRAVGRANHENPIPIIIPCHRVLGRDGSLTGYAGGLDRKRLLLRLERARVEERCVEV